MLRSQGQPEGTWDPKMRKDAAASLELRIVVSFGLREASSLGVEMLMEIKFRHQTRGAPCAALPATLYTCKSKLMDRLAWCPHFVLPAPLLGPFFTLLILDNKWIGERLCNWRIAPQRTKDPHFSRGQVVLPAAFSSRMAPVGPSTGPEVQNDLSPFTSLFQPTKALFTTAQHQLEQKSSQMSWIL